MEYSHRRLTRIGIVSSGELGPGEARKCKRYRQLVTDLLGCRERALEEITRAFVAVENRSQPRHGVEAHVHAQASCSRSNVARLAVNAAPPSRSSAALSPATPAARRSSSPPRCAGRCTTAPAEKASLGRRSSNRSMPPRLELTDDEVQELEAPLPAARSFLAPARRSRASASGVMPERSRRRCLVDLDDLDLAADEA